MARVKTYYEDMMASATDYVITYVNTLYPNTVVDCDGIERSKDELIEWVVGFMEEAFDDILFDEIDPVQFPPSTFPADGKVKDTTNRIEYRLLEAMTDAVTIINENDW